MIFRNKKRRTAEILEAMEQVAIAMCDADTTFITTETTNGLLLLHYQDGLTENVAKVILNHEYATMVVGSCACRYTINTWTTIGITQVTQLRRILVTIVQAYIKAHSSHYRTLNLMRLAHEMTYGAAS